MDEQDIFDASEMQRKLTKPLNYKPVSEERYNQLIVPLKAMGVTIMRGDEDIEKHLDKLQIYVKRLCFLVKKFQSVQFWKKHIT